MRPADVFVDPDPPLGHPRVYLCFDMAETVEAGFLPRKGQGNANDTVDVPQGPREGPGGVSAPLADRVRL